ncbi:MAG: AbrB family transcriptional regulator [Methylocella sp.]
MPDLSGFSFPSRLSPIARWALLIVGSLLLAALLRMAGLPAALLLGPMIAAILLAVAGGIVRIPRPAYFASQAIIGCLVARAITPAILVSFAKDWPLFLGVVFAVIVASNLLGALMSRLRVLPGTTAIWGASPGAASAMVLMAEAYGADARLVAFMQYLRVVFVAAAASLVARFWVHASGAPMPAADWFAPIEWPSFAMTLALAGIGAFVGHRLRIPAGPLLAPMVVGAALHATGLLTIELPQWLLGASYAVVGWHIGLGFTLPILRHALRALPQVVASILALIAVGGGLAWLLTEFAGIDPLTAYLATSPGGMDSVAIIAASSKVDVSFVIALQTVRFVFVLILGPPLARLLADRSSGRALEKEATR